MRAHNAKSPEDYQKRIDDKCATLGYAFVRFLQPWKGNKTKFEMKCIKHGVFQASIDNFLSLGRKCTKCTKTYRYTQQEREEQLADLCCKTPYRFIGWENVYKSHKSKAVFHCEKHGEFLTIVNDFVSKGTRCAKCAGKYVRTQTEREQQLRNLCEGSGFSFVMWENGYTGDRSKAIFNCARHGNWIARPDNFIFKGTRCPKCMKTGFNRDKKGVVYFLQSEDSKYIKVGISNSFNRRIKELRRATPFNFSVVGIYHHSGQTVYDIENHFHRNFTPAGFRDFDGCSEWLVMNEKLKFLMQILGD